MSIVSVLKNLDQVIEDVKPLADIAGLGSVIRLVDTVVEIGVNTLDRVEEGHEVLASEDVAYIRSLIDKLREENAILNQRVKDS